METKKELQIKLQETEEELLEMTDLVKKNNYDWAIEYTRLNHFWCLLSIIVSVTAAIVGFILGGL